MRTGWNLALEERVRRADPAYRDILLAQAELAADLRQRRDQWELADSVVLRSHDFTAGNVLDAASETATLTLANAPAGNDRYVVHYRCQINVIVPVSNTNDHEVIVAIETNTDGAGWVGRATIRHFVQRSAGDPATAMVWEHEQVEVLVPGLDSTDEIRIRVVSATGPGGWSFTVHGFNAATDHDPADDTGADVGGVTYHTGRALTFRADGGVELADTIQIKFEQNTSDQFTTDLDGPPQFAAASPSLAARIVWGKDDPPDLVIDRIVAYLHPRQDGGQPKTVAYWICQPFALVRTHGRVGLDEVISEIAPLASPKVVEALGTSAEEITFSYLPTLLDPGVNKPRPKRVIPSTLGIGEHEGSPTTYVFIWAVKADGTPATNVGWGRDSATTSVTNGSRKLRTVRLTRLTSGVFSEEAPASLGATPRACHRIRIETGNYAASERLQFSGAGNDYDLGHTPTGDVEFTGVAEVPPGTTAVFEVLKDAGTAGTDADWRTFVDGQLVGTIADVTKRQAYQLRCRMGASASGDASPTVISMGVRELTQAADLTGVARIRSARWGFDPITRKAEITEAVLEAIRDGERDFEDAITSLLSEFPIGKLVFRSFVGALDLPRAQWMFRDEFLVDDQDPRGAAVTVTTLGVLQLVRGQLPRYNAASSAREVLVYANKSLKHVDDDLLGNQLAELVPVRYRGPGVPDGTTIVSKQIRESDAKEELDAIAYLAGGTRIASQGRLKFVDLVGSKRIVAVFPREEIQPLSMTPGHRQRVGEFFVRYEWNDDEGEYERETFASLDAVTLANLGRARIDPPTSLEHTIATWIRTEAHARRLAQERVQAFGTGLIQWAWRSIYPYPELEPGDLVAVETDWFVAHDPGAGRALKGALWALVIISQTNQDDRTFAGYVASYADIFATPALFARLGFGLQVTLAITWQGDRLILTYYGTAAVQSIRWATSQVNPFVDAAAGTIVNGQHGEVDLGAFAANQAIYVAVLPFSLPSGVGGAGPAARVRAKRLQAEILTLLATQSGTSPNVTVTFAATIDENTRELQWFHRVHATDWPTDDGTQNGPITQTTFFQQRKGVLAGLFGRSSTGAVIGAGLDYAVTGRSTGDRVAAIVIPIGHDGRPGPRMALAYTVSGTPPASVTPVTYVQDADGSSCSSLRTYDFTHTPNGQVDDDMEVRFYARINGADRELIATNASPSSVSATNNVSVNAYETGDIDDDLITVDIEFELWDGGNLLQSGVVGAQDFFNGFTCLA